MFIIHRLRFYADQLYSNIFLHIIPRQEYLGILTPIIGYGRIISIDLKSNLKVYFDPQIRYGFVTDNVLEKSRNFNAIG